MTSIGGKKVLFHIFCWGAKAFKSEIYISDYFLSLICSVCGLEDLVSSTGGMASISGVTKQ